MNFYIGKNIRQKLGGLGYKKYGTPKWSYRKDINNKRYFHIIIDYNGYIGKLHIDKNEIKRTKKGYNHETIQKNQLIKEEVNKLKDEHNTRRFSKS